MTDHAIPFANYSDEPVFNIQAVAEKTDVPALTLRAWERRYDIPKPNRDTQGHRLYSEQDVMIIKWLKIQIDSSMRIKQAVKLLNSQAPQELPAQDHNFIHSVAFDEPISNRFEPLVQELFGAIRDYDYPRAQRILTHTLSIYSIEDVCLGILIPTFGEIDMAYQTGEITLQAEHFGSNLIRERLLGILTTPSTPSRTGRIVVGCAPHEWHEIGPLMFSLFLRRRGWEVIYLGQNVGFAGLNETIRQLRPDVFTLSITHLPNIRYMMTAAEITADATRNRGIFTYAGPVFNRLDSLIEKLPGIFLGKNLADAVEHVEHLLTQREHPASYAPPKLKHDIQATLAYVDENRGMIEGHVGAILVSILEHPETVETSLLAQKVVDTISVALQYDEPKVLQLLSSSENGTFLSYGMDPSYLPQFVEALQAYVKADMPNGYREILLDSLEWLKPNVEN